MARTATLTVLLSDVRTKGDFAGATVRHTDAQITRLLNQSIQRFRERISDEGSTHYLVSSTGTLGVGPTSPFPFYQLDLSGVSPALVRTFGIDVTLPGGDVRTLDHVPFTERAKYGTSTQGGQPQAWAHFKRDQVAILPASDTAYSYTVWYLPVLADLASGSDTFDGVAGWEDFIVWDVVCQLIARDQFPQAYQIAIAQRESVWADILRGATKVSQAGGAHIGRDSFGGKLPNFLGGRRPTKAAVGGPVVPATGSVTDTMLADMTGPTVKGVLSGTTRPYSVGIATLTTYLSQFSTLQRGLVPAPLSVGSRYLDDSGNWSVPAGGGGGGSVGPSGAVQYQAGTGMAGASGLRIIGNSPSLLVRLEGSMRVTGGQVEVGSGTVKVSASGVDVGGGSVINVGTLVASAIAAPAFTDTTAGLAPLSGGGTSNFLRADGAWGVPPGTGGGGGGPTMLAGGALGAIQYNGGSGLKGTIFGNVRVDENGAGQGIGISWGSQAPSGQALNWGNGTRVQGRTASGWGQNILDWRTAVNGNVAGVSGAVLLYGNTSSAPTGDIQAHLFRTAASGFMQWQLGASGLATMQLTSSGIDLPLNARFGSLQVSSGIPNDQLSPMASGTIKGQLGADATPTDIPLQSLTTALYHFSATNRGVTPLSGGGTTNFLRADGTWAAPPGGSASAAGTVGAVQYNDGANGFFGASGITISGSGANAGLGGSANPAALNFGPAYNGSTGAGAGNGSIRAAGHFSIYGNTPSAVPVSLVDYRPTGLAALGATGGAALMFGESTSDRLHVGYHVVGSGGRFQWDIGSTSPAMRLSASGLNLSTLRLYASELRIGSGIPNTQLTPMASGTIKGQLGADGNPTDIPLQSLTTALYPFSATDRGVVPLSGGGGTNFLRADGTWAVPPGTGGAASPGGGTSNIQFRDAAGTFGGASGILAVASGSALQLGGPTAASVGWIRGGQTMSVYGQNPSLTDVRMLGMGTGAVELGQSGIAAKIYGDLSAQNLTLASGISNANLQPMGSGTIKGNLTGTGAPQDVPFATFMAFAPTFTATRMGVVPASAGGTSNYLRADGAWAAPSGAAQYPPVGGVSNVEMAVMSTGTVKANLSGNATPSDVPIATLLAFAPTFTATKLGAVPASGGGTANYLRADGTWASPPGQAATIGGGLGSLQYNDGGLTLGGATGVNITASGQALGFGVPSFYPGAGDIRVASGFNVTANLPSGVGGVAARQSLFDWSGGGGSGTLKVGGASGVLGTLREEVATGGSFQWLLGGQTGMSLSQTGIDASPFNLKVKSLDVGSINGLPFTWNNIKRGADIGGSSGVPSGLTLYTPRGSSTGANRYIVPSGFVLAGSGSPPNHVILSPTGARGGQVLRIERIDTTGAPLEVRTPTGTVLLSMPSGTKYWGDFMLTKPSGAAFELAGHADMF